MAGKDDWEWQPSDDDPEPSEEFPGGRYPKPARSPSLWGSNSFSFPEYQKIDHYPAATYESGGDTIFVASIDGNLYGQKVPGQMLVGKKPDFSADNRRPVTSDEAFVWFSYQVTVLEYMAGVYDKGFWGGIVRDMNLFRKAFLADNETAAASLSVHWLALHGEGEARAEAEATLAKMVALEVVSEKAVKAILGPFLKRWNKKLAQRMAMRKRLRSKFVPKFKPKGSWVKPKGFQLPAQGKWSGHAGDSVYYPDNPGAHGLDVEGGIRFSEGIPDFTPHSKGHFDVPGMTGDHSVDMPLIHEKIARDRGFLYRGKPNRSAAQRWLKEQDLVPHHTGGKRIDLVPKPIHDIHHTGGAAGLRQAG